MQVLMAQIGEQNKAVEITNRTLKSAEDAIGASQDGLLKYIENRLSDLKEELTKQLNEAKLTLSD